MAVHVVDQLVLPQIPHLKTARSFRLALAQTPREVTAETVGMETLSSVHLCYLWAVHYKLLQDFSKLFSICLRNSWLRVHARLQYLDVIVDASRENLIAGVVKRHGQNLVGVLESVDGRFLANVPQLRCKQI